jgi:hypothetical protein
MILFGWWVLEQGPWAAPLAGGLVFALLSRRRRREIAGVMCVLAVLFVANLVGWYPGPARVSCSIGGGVPVCIERTAGVERAGDDRRPGAVRRPVLTAEPWSGSVVVEVETPWAVVDDGGSFRTGYPGSPVCSAGADVATPCEWSASAEAPVGGAA